MGVKRAAALPALAAVLCLVSPNLAAGAAVGPFAGTPKNVRSITPQVTSSSISSGAANHVVVPTGAGNGKLLVFLPGSGASPQGYDDILEAASADGYRAIGLTYNNAAPASAKCAAKPSCFGPLHQRVYNGTGSSTVSKVSPADGVAHRLAALLGYLNSHYPNEGWSAYLNNGATRWSKVVIAGHSQGAGEAAYIASIRKVAGALLFAGVVDGNGSSPLATWLDQPHVTPSSRYAALTNTKDTWFSRQLRSWVALGIPGAEHPQSIDSPVTVTAATHAFVTSAAARIAGALSEHDEVAADPYVPVCSDGSPRLVRVWTAMLDLVAGAQQAYLTTACVAPASARVGSANKLAPESLALVPRQSAPITVVPSAGLPPQVHVDRSNANLAVARFQGRYFLVFRTAKWQIADDKTRLYVISSRDQVHWRYEGQFHYGRDLREPRFLVWHKQLFLYFALLGQNAAAFQPGGELVTRYRAVGKWTKPVKAMPQPDFIAWAFKTYRGRAYMTGYNGGGGTFTPNPPPKREYWMTSRDAIHWHPVHANKPVVYTGQCGEVDFAFLPGGGLVTACQTEEVDQLGWGAKVCTAPAHATWKWTCRGDRRRLDSPYVFVDRGHAYVIARRQVAFGGDYDFLGFNLPQTDVQFAVYDGSYAATTKRCSLWRINLRTRDFTPLVDVPGTGDTCYPEVIPQRHHRYLVYNYTSPLTSDPPWGTALLAGKTLIYRETLTLS